MKKHLPKFAALIFSLFIWLPLGLLAQDVTEVADLAGLKQQEADGTVYRVTGEVVLTFQQSFRGQKFVQDDAAGILIDDNSGTITSSYNRYDGITGLTGTLSIYGNMVQFVPVEDPGAATSTGNTVTPVVVTLEEYNTNFMNYQSRLVTLEGVSFTDPTGTFANGQEYVVTDGTNEAIFRTTFYDVDYIGDAKLSGDFNLTGIPNSRSGGDYITARDWNDIESLSTVTVTFEVVDDALAPITDAVLTFDGTALAAGEYVITEVPEGTYDYSVAKDGYVTQQGSLVVSTEDVTYQVILVEEDTNAITTFPWTEDFTTFLPEGWSTFSVDGAGTWVQLNEAAHHASDTEAADSWLVTPQIVVPDAVEGEPAMILKFMESNAFMTTYGYSGVMISTGSGIPANDQFVEVYESSANIGNTPVERIINLGDYAGQVIYIAFVYQGVDAHEWTIDDVTVEQAPSVIEVPNLAALYDYPLGDGQVYRVTGEVVITHKQLAYRNQMYVQDGEGAIIIDDAPQTITTSYDVYDGITGLTGTISAFNDNRQLVPTEDPGAATSTGNTVEPLEITLSELTEDLQAMLVIIRDVTIDVSGDTPETWVQSQAYPVSDATGSSTIFTPNAADALDYYGDDVPTSVIDLISVVQQYRGTMQLLPRSSSDFMEPASNVPQLEQVAVNMYPNPARDAFTVDSKAMINMVRVYDMSGRLLVEQPVNDNRVTIETTMLRRGIYLVQIDSQGGTLSKKLQVIR
ncbi:MAG: DUF5689 domain-containing protein [Bacteroidales bacterium]